MIVPKPVIIEYREASFPLDAKTGVWVDNMAIVPVVSVFAAKLGATVNCCASVESCPENSIFFTCARPDEVVCEHFEADEKYEITVSSSQVVCEAATRRGVSWAVQTLLQLCPARVFCPNMRPSSEPIAAVRIEDFPRFSYRGMHLDVCRHFFDVDFVKRYIDLLAMHRMNLFHWHLTEDQGWRIEIKKYPKLTEVGAFRTEADGAQYGGFYTQEEIKEVVDYATARAITVIPEIELPGHALAAIAAYPEFSCGGGPFEVETTWGIFDDVYCAGKEGTFEFVQNVLDEVMALFPSKYIHIGGDECPKARWKSCPDCQRRIAEEGLKDEFELQSYFIRRIETYLNSKNRKLIGWDEILEGGLAPDATVMSWRGTKGGIEAAKQGHDVIMTPTSHCYFDHYQGRRAEEPKAIGGHLDLEQVYSFEPVADELSEAEAQRVKGGQGNVWTEYMPDSNQVEYMVLPRMSALAEALWMPASQKKWADFQWRMGTHYHRFEALGLNYRVPVPKGPGCPILFSDKTIVELAVEKPADKIYYTLSGDEPTEQSAEYTQALEFEANALIKARAYTKSGRASRVVEFTVKKSVLKPAVRCGTDSVTYNAFKWHWKDSDELCPEKWLKAGDLDAVVMPADLPNKEFAVEILTFVTVPTDGVYTFYANADQGTTLEVNYETVIDRQPFGGKMKPGMAVLAAGSHHLRVVYYKTWSESVINLEIEGPGVARQSLNTFLKIK